MASGCRLGFGFGNHHASGLQYGAFGGEACDFNEALAGEGVYLVGFKRGRGCLGLGRHRERVLRGNLVGGLEIQFIFPVDRSSHCGGRAAGVGVGHLYIPQFIVIGAQRHGVINNYCLCFLRGIYGIVLVVSAAGERDTHGRCHEKGHGHEKHLSHIFAVRFWFIVF